MTRSAILGYPRFGLRRELKRATEAYWKGRTDAAQLGEVAAGLRRDTWTALAGAGITDIPSNHFSLYDHVLDAIAMVGAVPARYGHHSGTVGLDTYFAMARGTQDGAGMTAMEMTKWFDTNYHYIVPELGPETRFQLSTTKAVDEFIEARAIGVSTRPVLVGPVTLLLLGKATEGTPEGFERLSLLEPLLDVYADLLIRLRTAGAEWVQLDEPAFVQDRSAADLAALERAYEHLGGIADRPRILLATYFDHAGDAMPILARAPVDGLALDFTREAETNLALLSAAGGIPGKTLFAGVVDGRNVWVNDLERSRATLRRAAELAGEVVVSTSCSLLHTPLDLGAEHSLDPEVASWLAFARQKVSEVTALARAFDGGLDTIADELEINRASLESRRSSAHTASPAVRARLAAVSSAQLSRSSPHATRAALQQRRLNLQALPTTTIGSFPQTPEIRAARAALHRGDLDEAGYRSQMEAEIGRVVRLQEEIGLDVLVHGEPERNDMVQYFAEQLDGFAFTENGWVQSYGTRYVRPPIIFGDVSRPRPMTVDWASYAQSLTRRPMKGMLTGPITMLRWSFVRDDQPLADTARQIAMALRDEVTDLEAAGIGVIQVDEPAIREGLPLRREHHADYMRWAVESFRLATSGVRDDTQIHTHMCYSEFGEIISVIADLDADVTSVEAARSRMELVHDLARTGYSRGIGPGVYDIHSPRVPSATDIEALLTLALTAIASDRLWVNPDCGLKTRAYAEVEPALRHMVEAASRVRATLHATAGEPAAIPGASRPG